MRFKIKPKGSAHCVAVPSGIASHYDGGVVVSADEHDRLILTTLGLYEVLQELIELRHSFDDDLPFLNTIPDDLRARVCVAISNSKRLLDDHAI
jgi:hypothetical protein